MHVATWDLFLSLIHLVFTKHASRIAAGSDTTLRCSGFTKHGAKMAVALLNCHTISDGWDVFYDRLELKFAEKG